MILPPPLTRRSAAFFCSSRFPLFRIEIPLKTENSNPCAFTSKCPDNGSKIDALIGVIGKTIAKK